MTEPTAPKRSSVEPVLIKWAVKYDDAFAMPEYVQGTFVGGDNCGQTVRVHDIESIDLFNNVLKTYDGQRIFLSGDGQRIVIFSDKEMMDYDDDDFV